MTPTNKPILFNTEMVRAVVNGKKTMTRRVIKVENPDEWQSKNDCRKHEEGSEVPCHLSRIKTTEFIGILYPKYDVGDILWVRETWAKISDYATPDTMVGLPDGYLYKATGEYHMGLKWRPSIFMPKEAARIFLRVTDVKVGRVQDILCGDMKREGCIPETVTGCQYQQWHHDYWIPLWDSINAKRGYSWSSNPWVWVYSFKLMEDGV